MFLPSRYIEPGCDVQVDERGADEAAHLTSSTTHLRHGWRRHGRSWNPVRSSGLYGKPSAMQTVTARGLDAMDDVVEPAQLRRRPSIHNPQRALALQGPSHRGGAAPYSSARRLGRAASRGASRAGRAHDT